MKLWQDYIEADQLIHSVVSGKGCYQWMQEPVKHPFHEEDGPNRLLENIHTQEKCFMKRVRFFDQLWSVYARQIQYPPYLNGILWPCDMVLTEEDPKCLWYVEKSYGWGPSREQKSPSKLALIFPRQKIQPVENGSLYYASLQEQNWKNPKVQHMIWEIADVFYQLNQSGYFYLDFCLDRFFFQGNGRLFLDYSNLIYSENRNQRGLHTTESGKAAMIVQGAYPIEFAEPALVQGKSDTVDVNSQNYSLAALFFYLMFHRYAYEGKLMDGYSDQNEREHFIKFRDYHKMPIFIFDWEDKSNAIGDFAEEREIVALWEDLPLDLKQLFRQALGRENAERRIPSRSPAPEEWLRCLKCLGWGQTSEKCAESREEGWKY